MNESEQINAISKLEGHKMVGLMKHGLWYRPKACGYTSIEYEAGRWTIEEAEERACGKGQPDEVRVCQFSPKPYLTSRDAIVPVIEKFCGSISNDGERWLCFFEALLEVVLMLKSEKHRASYPVEFVHAFFTATPAQLSEALLRSTGIWK